LNERGLKETDISNRLQAMQTDDLDRKAVSRKHYARFFVYYEANVMEISFTGKEVDLQVWYIQGGRWKTVPMPCPAKAGQTE